MEFYRYWRILMAHRWVLIWLPAVATCIALGLSFVLPEQYESTALVLVRPFEEIKFNPSGSDQKVSEFPVNLSAPIDALSKTYMEVIKSPVVAVKIVNALQLQVEKPKKYENLFEAIKDDASIWAGNAIRALRNYCKYGRDIPASPVDIAVENVEENLTVSVRKDTYAFDITDRSSDPQQAAAIANMAAEIFVEHSSEAYSRESARARQFIDVQVDHSRKALETAQTALLGYKNSSGTFDLTSQYDDIQKNVSDLENTLAKAEAKLAGLKRLAGEFTPNVIAQETEIAALTAQIAALDVQLASYPQKERQINALILNRRLAEESYEFFLKQDEQARVNESATVTEIRIISPAMPGRYPVKPLKYVYAGLSFATALVVAVGFVLLLESMEPRVRTVGDLDGELGLPVLGAIPRGVPSGQQG